VGGKNKLGKHFEVQGAIKIISGENSRETGGIVLCKRRHSQRSDWKKKGGTNYVGVFHWNRPDHPKKGLTKTHPVHNILSHTHPPHTFWFLNTQRTRDGSAMQTLFFFVASWFTGRPAGDLDAVNSHPTSAKKRDFRQKWMGVSGARAN